MESDDYTSIRRRRDKKEGSSIWAVLNKIIIVPITIIVMTGFFIWIIPQFSKLKETQKTLDDKKEELAQEELTRKKNQRKIKMLDGDPEFIETEARDKLHLRKPNERIFHFDESQNN